jgi:hypothetical protein
MHSGLRSTLIHVLRLQMAAGGAAVLYRCFKTLKLTMCTFLGHVQGCTHSVSMRVLHDKLVLAHVWQNFLQLLQVPLKGQPGTTEQKTSCHWASHAASISVCVPRASFTAWLLLNIIWTSLTCAVDTEYPHLLQLPVCHGRWSLHRVIWSM